MTSEELKAIRERNVQRAALKSAATDGPWRNDRGERVWSTTGGGWGDDAVLFEGKNMAGTPADMAFCAAARSDPVEKDVADLLVELGRLRQLVRDETALLGPVQLVEAGEPIPATANKARKK
jgi:hypothetical protein